MTFQVLSSYIMIFEIDKVDFFPDLGPVQYVKYRCHVTQVYFEKWPNSIFLFFAHGLWSESSKFKVTQGVRLFEKIPCLRVKPTKDLDFSKEKGNLVRLLFERFKVSPNYSFAASSNRSSRLEKKAFLKIIEKLTEKHR